MRDLNASERADYVTGAWLGTPIVVSPSGVVHELCGRERLGRPITRCGAYVETGWLQGTQLEPDDEICANCNRLHEAAAS